MENELVTALLALLIGLIALSLLFWTFRLVWNIIRSPVAFAILLSLLALLTSLMALGPNGG